MSKNPDYDEDKFAELMLYIADQMEDEPWYGATMLNKVLFFSDFLHYAEHGESITGAEYHRLDHGPAPRRLLPVRNDLIATERAVIKERQVGARVQQRLLARVEPDLSEFTATEIKTVDSVISALKDHTATAVSDLTHTMSGWQIASDREEIPYQSVFLTSAPVNDDDRATAESLVGLAEAALA